MHADILETAQEQIEAALADSLTAARKAIPKRMPMHAGYCDYCESKFPEVGEDGQPTPPGKLFCDLECSKADERERRQRQRHRYA